MDGKMTLDPDTYLSGTQEYRYEVPEPCAQPHQQPEGPQEPRLEAERAQWGHLPRAHRQDDSRGEEDHRALVQRPGQGPLAAQL